MLVSQLHPLHLPLLHKHQHMMYTTTVASPPSPFQAARPVFIIMFRNHCPASCRTRLPSQGNSSRIRLRGTRPPAFEGSAPQPSGRPSPALRGPVLSPASEASPPSLRGNLPSLPGYPPPKAGSTSCALLRPPLPSSPLGGVWIVKLGAGRNTLYIPGLLLDSPPMVYTSSYGVNHVITHK